MSDISQVVKVGIADLNLVKAPDKIRTSGLGSCVGVILYDPFIKIAGLVHVMLPDSALSKKGNITLAKFADSGVMELRRQLLQKGANPRRIRSKIAGGAQMFQFQSQNEMMQIGKRNVESVEKVLKELQVPIISKDVYGNSGRTIEFDPQTSMLMVRTVNHGIKSI